MTVNVHTARRGWSADSHSAASVNSAKATRAAVSLPETAPRARRTGGEVSAKETRTAAARLRQMAPKTRSAGGVAAGSLGTAGRRSSGTEWAPALSPHRTRIGAGGVDLLPAGCGSLRLSVPGVGG